MGTTPKTSVSPGAIASAFRMALDAACEFEGATAPNPTVGCAVLDASGRVLAVAAHQRAGEGHAEARAIAQCRGRGLANAIHTLVVTLEPCNHFGRAPPCSHAILLTPARAVWIGVHDRNCHVAGGGSDTLTAAGVAVKSIATLDHPDAPSLSIRAERLIAPFARRQRTGMPWITIKQALDISGSMIPPAGSKTCTSPASLVLAHHLRRRADAILTGSGTILADAPFFTVRHLPDFPGKIRHLVILDRRGRIGTHYLAAARERGFLPILATDIPAALRRMCDIGALEVLFEAGPGLTSNILAAGLWDEHVRITVNGDGTDRIEISTNRSISPSYAERT